MGHEAKAVAEGAMVGAAKRGKAGLASSFGESIKVEDLLRALMMSRSSRLQPHRLEGKLLSRDFEETFLRDFEE